MISYDFLHGFFVVIVFVVVDIVPEDVVDIEDAEVNAVVEEDSIDPVVVDSAVDCVVDKGAVTVGVFVLGTVVDAI